MATHMDIVFGTHNTHKRQELQTIASTRGITLLANPSPEDPEETEITFVGNALLKALHTAQHTKHWVIAEDSGLCVPLLGGAPGIYSARYAGSHGNHAQNNLKLCEALQDKGVTTQTPAYYLCLMVLVKHPKDPHPIICEGLMHGSITVTPPAGSEGFGYDPLFIPQGEEQTLGQLPPSFKASHSHRAQAFSKILAAI